MPERPLTFYETVTAAVRDFSEHGFQSIEQLERWVRLIREAALRSMTPEYVLTQSLRTLLSGVYKRLVTDKKVLRYHPDISHFTLQRVAPKLRAELDRRIMTAASLIKLNREQAISETLRRFSGWATSIPQGGSDAVEKNPVKSDIRKSLAQLPFRERRVLIDQGHKLTASINNVVAEDGGAIALIWHSHWREINYNYREDHKERDLNYYAIRGNWAIEKGLMKVGEHGYYDEITAVGEEVYCRCYAQYIYSIRRLPDDMITDKGRAFLARGAMAV